MRRDAKSAAPSKRRPWIMAPRRWLTVLSRTGQSIFDDSIGLTAAGIAFYTLLSIFPGIAAIVSLWSLFADPEQIALQIDQLSGFAPPDVVEILRSEAVSVAAADQAAIGLTFILSLLFSLFSASRAIKAIMQALNIVYDEEEERGFLKFNALALAITLAVAVGFIGAIIAIVAVPILLGLVGLGNFLEPFLWIVRWPLLFAGAWLAIAALYRFAPSRSTSARTWLSPGAGAAVILWLFASILFSLYVQNFANYNETYGSLGAVVIALMWFWVSAFVFLVGAEVDSELEKLADEHGSSTGMP